MTFAKPSVRTLLVFCFVLTAFLYAPTVRAGFVYDDLWYLARNPSVRSLHIVSFFTDPRTSAAPESGLSGDVYRPLGTLAFALVFKGWKLWAWPTHLLEIFLHLFNGFLFWRILKMLLKDGASALFGTFVFLLHPVQVQSVAWISQLSGLVGTAGFLAAFGYFIENDVLSPAQMLFGWAAFGVAVLSRKKRPLGAAAYDRFVLAAQRTGQTPLRNRAFFDRRRLSFG